MMLSIVIPVLNSHEVVRRQLLHFERMELPSNVEIIIVDDGSDPPLMDHPSIRNQFVRPCTAYPPGSPRFTDAFDDVGMNLCIAETLDTRPWTWALARNAGARLASGEYLLMTDIDHIIPKEALDDAMAFEGLRMRFKRQFGILDEQGLLTQDRDVLERYGLPRKSPMRVPPLPNNFVMRRDVFWELGGYLEDRVGKPYPQGEDRMFKKAWLEYMDANGLEEHPHSPTLFMFPNGKWCGDVDYNPMGLFHGLSRKTNRNYWYQQQRKAERVKS